MNQEKPVALQQDHEGSMLRCSLLLNCCCLVFVFPEQQLQRWCACVENLAI